MRTPKTTWQTRGGLLLLPFLLAWISVPGSAQKSGATAHYEQGVKENREGHLVAASVSFTEALSLRPDYPEAYVQRALSFEGMGKHEAAIQDYSAAIEHGSDHLLPYQKLFAWCRSQELYDRGVDVASALIRNIPANAVAGHWEMGGFLESLKDKPGALASYRLALDALSIGPDASAGERDFHKTLERKVRTLKKALE